MQDKAELLVDAFTRIQTFLEPFSYIMNPVQLIELIIGKLPGLDKIVKKLGQVDFSAVARR